jgi:hypothetical protein
LSGSIIYYRENLPSWNITLNQPKLENDKTSKNESPPAGGDFFLSGQGFLASWAQK